MRWGHLVRMPVADPANAHGIFLGSATGWAGISNQQAGSVNLKRVNAGMAQKRCRAPGLPEHWRPAAATLNIKQLWIVSLWRSSQFCSKIFHFPGSWAPGRALARHRPWLVRFIAHC